jgi:hypothetical protein
VAFTELHGTLSHKTEILIAIAVALFNHPDKESAIKIRLARKLRANQLSGMVFAVQIRIFNPQIPCPKS